MTQQVNTLIAELDDLAATGKAMDLIVYIVEQQLLDALVGNTNTALTTKANEAIHNAYKAVQK